MPPDNERGRPPTGAAPDVSADHLDESQSTRCRVCGHALHARRSVELGIGPVCRRREERSRLAGVTTVHVTAWQAAIAEVIACAA